MGLIALLALASMVRFGYAWDRGGALPYETLLGHFSWPLPGVTNEEISQRVARSVSSKVKELLVGTPGLSRKSHDTIADLTAQIASAQAIGDVELYMNVMRQAGAPFDPTATPIKNIDRLRELSTNAKPWDGLALSRASVFRFHDRQEYKETFSARQMMIIRGKPTFRPSPLQEKEARVVGAVFVCLPVLQGKTRNLTVYTFAETQPERWNLCDWLVISDGDLNERPYFLF